MRSNRWISKRMPVGVCTAVVAGMLLIPGNSSALAANDMTLTTPMPSPRVMAPLDGARDRLVQSWDKTTDQVQRIRPMEAPVRPYATTDTTTTRTNWGWGWLGLIGLAGLFGLFRPAEGNQGEVRT